MNPLLLRMLLAVGLILLGIGLYLLLNRVLLSRAGRNNLGLEQFQPGIPAVLYFTMEGCVPCRMTQRPALKKLSDMAGDQIQIIQVDVVEEPQLAESWGVLSVPTTFIIDPLGRPRRVNHGVALAEKLLDQIEEVSGRKLVNPDHQDSVECRAASPGMD